MFREALVQERVVRPKQVEHAAILTNHAVDKELRLLPERLTQVVVEIREETHVRRDRVEVAQMQPLRREVGHQVLRPWIGQHPLHLPLEHRRLVEIAARGNVQQLVVGNAAPEEE